MFILLKYFRRVLVVCLTFLLSVGMYGQQKFAYPYLFPVPASMGLSPYTPVMVRWKNPVVSAKNIPDTLFTVCGSLSGKHKGKITLASDRKTLAFIPDLPFSCGETVEVIFSGVLKDDEGNILPRVFFDFYIRKNSIEKIKDNVLSDNYAQEKKTDNLSFPEFVTERYAQSATGSFIFAVSPFLAIVDGEGVPVFLRRENDGVRNFTLQDYHLLTYYNNATGKFYVLNGEYHIIDSLTVTGGYQTDFHSLKILPDGHILMMATDPQKVDMSAVVNGGNTHATVTGFILQEQDSLHHLLFQWRSRDHFNITDADTSLVDLTSDVIDYVHANSFDVTPDGNYLLTSRNMSEITKIDRQTGDIIWRFGGKNNQFSSASGPVTIHAIHSALLTDDAHLLLFDNGSTDRSKSWGEEFFVDQQQKTAQLLHRYRHTPDVFVPVMGNIQTINEAQRLVGWGKNGTLLATIFDTNAIPLFELRHRDQDPYWSYRVSFGKWHDSLLNIPEDTLSFGNVLQEDSALMTVSVVNTGTEDMVMTGYSVNDPSFACANTCPLTLAVHDTASIDIKYKPDTMGTHNSRLMLFFTPASADPGIERIVRKIYVYGSSEHTSSRMDDHSGRNPVKIVPNPFYNTFRLYSHKGIKQAYVTDMSGKVIYIIRDPWNGMSISLDPYPSGMYLLYLVNREGSHIIRKMVKY